MQKRRKGIAGSRKIINCTFLGQRRMLCIVPFWAAIYCDGLFRWLNWAQRIPQTPAIAHIRFLFRLLLFDFKVLQLSFLYCLLVFHLFFSYR